MIEVYVDLPESSPIYKELQDLILKVVQKVYIYISLTEGDLVKLTVM